ncbi:MAG: hypothetical protein JSW54_06085 [Fidelibacterota bacterium]|nr:MAG: hypothetical protein JSW54_06085 [Candidatus Neomarinimicrobiota bacterium]
MKKKFPVIIALALLACSDKNAPDVAILVPADNDEVSGIVTVKVAASDDEEMDKVELIINGDLFETIKGEKLAYEFSWDTDEGENGEYSLLAKAHDKAGNSAMSDIVNVTVLNTRTYKFMNVSWDEIYFTFLDIEDVISWNDSIEVEVPKNYGEANFYGYSGQICGNTIYWNADIEIGSDDATWYFWVNPTYFYLLLSNQSTVYIDCTYINKDLPQGESLCDIAIPNDNAIYRMGYYYAYSNSNVYCYLLNHPQYESVYVDPISLPGEVSQYYYFETGLFKTIRGPVTILPDDAAERDDLRSGLISRERVTLQKLPFETSRLRNIK